MEKRKGMTINPEFDALFDQKTSSSRIKGAITYFEDAIDETDEIIAECSEDLQVALMEQKEFFVTAVDVMKRFAANKGLSDNLPKQAKAYRVANQITFPKLNGLEPPSLDLQMLKVVEELGEVSQAICKGESPTRILEELGDAAQTIVTLMFVISEQFRIDLLIWQRMNEQKLFSRGYLGGDQKGAESNG